MITKICREPGCTKPSKSRGLCSPHYMQFWRYGNFTPNFQRSQNGDALYFLETSLKNTSIKCVLWPFARNNDGYAVINGKANGGFPTNLVHKIVCIETHGHPSKAKPFACHTCGKGHLGCINSQHLYWGSEQDNKNDMVNHGNSARGARNPGAKLNTPDVLNIRKMIKAGRNYETIADKYGVQPKAIERIATGIRWGWL